MKRYFEPPIFIIIAVFSFIAKAEDLAEPWRNISDLIESKDYPGAIDRLRANAKSAKNEDIAEIYYRIGFIYSDYMHDYDKALESYQEVVKAGKASTSQELRDYVVLSRNSIADIYRKTGKYEEAIDEYKGLASDYPKTEYSQIAIKHINGIENALEQIQLYENIISEYPDTEFAAGFRLEIAELYLSPQNLNNPEKAIKEYKKIAKEYSNSQIGAEALLRIGNIYRRILIKPVDAIATYQGILESPFATSKLGAEAIFGIGMSYYNDMQDYIKASEAFKKLLNDYPTYWKYPAGIYWLGMCHEKLGDYENAIRNFELFYEIYPDEEPVWLADIGRFGEKDVKPRIRIKIDELKKTEPSMRWNKAEELLSQGSYIESLSAYQELISKHPDSEYSQRAKIQADKIKYLAEIQICKEKIKRKDISAPASQYRIAEIFETQMQDYLRAIEEYEKLVSEYPGTYWSAAALYRIGFIYSRTDSSKVIPFKADYKIRDQKIPDYRKAIEIYNRLISEYPGTYIAAEAQYQIGEIYTNNIGDHNKAIEEYGKFVKKYPRRNFYMGEGYKDSLADEAQFKIGKIYYENLRDYDMALKAFRAFTEEYPDSCRKAAAYSYIAAILEKINDPMSSVNFLEQAIQLISDSHIQTSFFLTNSFYDVKPSKNLNVQQDIIRQLKQRAYKIKGSTD